MHQQIKITSPATELWILLFQDDRNAQIYVLFMKRIAEKGLEFIDAEKSRIQNLLAGKMNDNKRAELNQKLNILSAFSYEEENPIRNEL